MSNKSNSGRLERRFKYSTGFSLIESISMLVAIGVFTWICLGVLKMKGLWPFDKGAIVNVQKV